ncbi:unnamed protein product, partial [Polarella glacialis]
APAVAPPRRPSAEEQAGLDETRLGDEARWQNFEREARVVQPWLRPSQRFVVDASSVPWPRGPPGNALALHGGIRDDEVRRLLQVALLRFHPDKFMARWRTKIPEAEQQPGSRLQKLLAQVVRDLLQLRLDWVPPAPAASQGSDFCCICLEVPERPDLRLRTTCCRQLLCTDCFAADQGRLEVPRCPYCRRDHYQAADGNARGPPAPRRRRSRSRSGRRAAALRA